MIDVGNVMKSILFQILKFQFDYTTLKFFGISDNHPRKQNSF